MSDIDWSKAPEWATHAGAAGKKGILVWTDGNQYRYINGDCEGKTFLIGSQITWQPWEIEIIESRPIEWNGEGLPPVGTVCEYYWAADDSWRSGTCVAHFDGRAVICDFDDEDCAERLDAHHVRATRTPEQIAAEEREKAIMEIYQTICISRAQAEAIYDAGYRKQPTNQPQEDK